MLGSESFIYIYIYIYTEMNTFIQQGCIKFIIIDSTDIYNVTKNSLVLFNFLFIKESWQNFLMFSTKIFSSQLFSTFIIISRKVTAPNHCFRMISEGSCDWRLESWFWKCCFAITKINYILKCSNRKISFNISQSHYFYCILYQMNTALLSIRDFFQKYYKNLTDCKLLNL